MRLAAVVGSTLSCLHPVDMETSSSEGYEQVVGIDICKNLTMLTHQIHASFSQPDTRGLVIFTDGYPKDMVGFLCSIYIDANICAWPAGVYSQLRVVLLIVSAKLI